MSVPLRLEQYFRFLELIGSPEWQEEPRYRNRRAMSEEYPDESEALIAPWFKERTKEEIFKLCMEAKVPCAPVRTIEEVVKDEHLNWRGYFQEVEHPVAGKVKHPGSPFRLSKTPGELGVPPPCWGSITKRSTAAGWAFPRRSWAATDGGYYLEMQALAGYRVIDIGYVLAGPLVTQFMADMGAEVIKVESRTRLDGTRRGRPHRGGRTSRGETGACGRSFHPSSTVSTGTSWA